MVVGGRRRGPDRVCQVTLLRTISRRSQLRRNHPDYCANNRNAVIKGDLGFISDPYFILAQIADPEQVPSFARRPIAVETSRQIGDLQSFSGLGNRRTRHNKTLGESLGKSWAGDRLGLLWGIACWADGSNAGQDWWRRCYFRLHDGAHSIPILRSADDLLFRHLGKSNSSPADLIE
jgi:hypothetical protein